MWSFIIQDLLSTLSFFAQIRLCPVLRFLGSSLSRWYASISAADSTIFPSVGGSKSISSTFFGVVLIAPEIIMPPSLDHAEAMSVMSYHAAVACMIFVYTFIEAHVILGESSQALPINALHDHRALSPFSTCVLTCAFHGLLSRMALRYLISFHRFN